MKQKLIELKGKIDKSTVLARDFNTLSILRKQVETNKDIENLKNEAEGIFFHLFYKGNVIQMIKPHKNITRKLQTSILHRHKLKNS